jgi:cellulose synthase (UDP-forming)
MNRKQLPEIHDHTAASLKPRVLRPPSEGPAAAVPMKKLSPHGQLKQAIMRLAMVLATAFTLRYFYWRAVHTMNPAAKFFFYAFLAAEFLSFLESGLFYFVGWSPTHYNRPKPLAGRNVDVFIPTYNEPVELLRETVVCALGMNYPHKTYILDDGRREEVRRLAQELNCGYLTRDDNKHAKAGNLNNALKQTSGEFIVTLDADHVATPELIDEMLGFFADPEVAIVQSTQNFYNLDSFQHRVNWETRAGWQQQELFFSIIQPGKDRYNAAFYCGSPGIIRRKALDEIGGFPTSTITEDMHTSLRLQKRGWRVLYFNRTLARGLAPQTYEGFATQWRRWGKGAMQVLRAEKPLTSPGLNFPQKLAYFSSFYFYWMSFVKLAFVLTPIVALLFATFPLFTDPVSYASFFMPYFFLNLACSVLVQGGVRNFISSETFNLLKMHVLMGSFAGLLQRDSKFAVTPKARAASARVNQLLLPVFLLIALVASLAVGTFRILHVPAYGYAFWALAINIFWVAVFMLMIGTVVSRSLRRTELRSGYRFRSHLDIPIRVFYTDPDGRAIQCEQFASNLNRSGVSVSLETAIVPGTAVDVELWLPRRTVSASGKVVRNKAYKENGVLKLSNGIRFDEISAADQDEITKYLFWELAPREDEVLKLTHESQVEESA